MSDNRTHKEFLTDAIPVTNHGNPVDSFIQEQIRLWGFDSVQKMFDDGFEPILVGDKVIWAK